MVNCDHPPSCLQHGRPGERFQELGKNGEIDYYSTAHCSFSCCRFNSTRQSSQDLGHCSAWLPRSRSLFSMAHKTQATVQHGSQDPGHCSAWLSRPRPLFSKAHKTQATVQHGSQDPGYCSAWLTRPRPLSSMALKTCASNNQYMLCLYIQLVNVGGLTTLM